MCVCVCVCVWLWLKLERTFPKHLSPAISSLAINTFVFSLEVGLEISLKEQKLRERVSAKTSIQVRAGCIKGQKQGRDGKTREQYPTKDLWCSPLWPAT